MKTGGEPFKTKMTKLTWRLSKLPTVEELQNLVKDKIITQEEAREILFTSEEDRSKKDLETEIEFLRKIIDKLSDNKFTKIVEVIRDVKPIYIQQPWYQPYYTWCSTTAGNTAYVNGSLTATSGTATLTTTGSNNAVYTAQTASAPAQFSSIKTF